MNVFLRNDSDYSPEKSKEYDRLGYKRRVEVRYNVLLKATMIYEYIYDPNYGVSEGCGVDCWSVTFYSGKPNMEKTKKWYQQWKDWNRHEEVPDDVEYVEWIPPEERETSEEVDEEETDVDPFEESRREQEEREQRRKEREERKKHYTPEQRKALEQRRMKRMETTFNYWLVDFIYAQIKTFQYTSDTKTTLEKLSDFINRVDVEKLDATVQEKILEDKRISSITDEELMENYEEDK